MISNGVEHILDTVRKRNLDAMRVIEQSIVNDVRIPKDLNATVLTSLNDVELLVRIVEDLEINNRRQHIKLIALQRRIRRLERRR